MLALPMARKSSFSTTIHAAFLRLASVRPTLAISGVQ
jgi:hypothetical protein